METAGVQRGGERREGGRDQTMGSFLLGKEEKAEKEGTGLEEETGKGNGREDFKGERRKGGGRAGWMGPGGQALTLVKKNRTPVKSVMISPASLR